MRTTKFRVWDMQTKRMIYAEDRDIFWIGLDGGVRVIGNGGDILNGVSVELLQWTGRKDKNGKEIYSEDIVKVHKDYHNHECPLAQWNNDYYYSGEKEPYDVVKVDEHFPYTEQHCSSPCEIEPKYCEVISNVWEHPELLK